jgi:hypothetical protein
LRDQLGRLLEMVNLDTLEVSRIVLKDGMVSDKTAMTIEMLKWSKKKYAAIV